jgi:hypothetical protein
MPEIEGGYTDEELRIHWANQKKVLASILLPIFLLFVFLSTLKVITITQSNDYWARFFESKYPEFARTINQQHPFHQRDFAFKAISDYLNNIFKVRDVESININIDFEGLNYFKARRNALGPSSLQGEEPYKKVTIDWREDQLRGKMKLKGLGPDHRDHPTKWSFAISLKGDDSFLGMNRFSIHHPKTRDYQGECLYSKILIDNGDLAARCEFIEVSINGESIGVMTATERVSKNLLEMQGRKEGNIFRPSYEDMWKDLGRAAQFKRSIKNPAASKSFQLHTEAHALNRLLTPLEVYGSGKLSESDELTKQYSVAIGLWEGMLSGHLRPSDIFDIESTARIIAATFAVGNFHSLQTHNIKLYFNPLTYKFEILPTDAVFGRSPSPRYLPPNGLGYIWGILVSDRELYRELLEQINLLVQRHAAEGSPFGADFSIIESQYLDVLRPEFPFIVPHNTETFGRRFDTHLKALTSNTFFLDYAPLDHTTVFAAHPDFDLGNPVFASFYNTPEGIVIRVINRYSFPMKVDGYELEYFDSTEVLRKSFEMSDIEVPATMHGIGESGSRVAGEVSISVPTVSGIERLKLLLSSEDNSRSYSANVSAYPAPVKTHVLSPSDLGEILETHQFFKLNTTSKVLTIPSGKWRITTFIKPPPGYGLIVEAGAELLFDANAGFLLRGPIRVLGSPQNSVTFSGYGGAKWRGISLINSNYWSHGQRSSLKNTVISGTRNAAYGPWEITGGVTFYKSDVDIISSTISGTEAEDALNIVHSDFTLVDAMISDTRSDAFDGDFSVGRIVNSTFARVGGDAIDFSGSEIDVEDSKFFTVADKAVSVGEQSSLTGRQLRIVDVGTGIVSKDGSQTRVDGVTFGKTQHYEVMAYSKKPQYGPAMLFVDNALADQKIRSIAQKKSTLRLNGETTPTQKLNVDALYDGYMAK